MALVRYSPWREMRNLEDQMTRFFGDLFPARREEREPAGSWEPAVDVYETDKEFVLKADLPEVEEKDVHVSVDGNILTLTGERHEEKEVKEEHYHRVERSYGTFSRSFVLPDSVDKEHINAAYKKGVMRLTLPKKAESKPKEIRIEVEE